MLMRATSEGIHSSINIGYLKSRLILLTFQRTLSLSERRGDACIHYPERRKSRRFHKIYFIGNRRYTSSAIEDILIGQSKYIFSENGMVSSNCPKPGFALLMYKQLTSEQRYTISVLLRRKCTKKEIAHAIGVSNSTITRELRRNSSSRGVYKWDKAQRQAEKRKRQMPGNRSIKPFVREMAIGLLKQRQWSPEQISGYLARM